LFLQANLPGKTAGEATAKFLCNSYYPRVFIPAFVFALKGLIAMYVGGQRAFSVRDLGGKKAKKNRRKKNASDKTIRSIRYIYRNSMAAQPCYFLS